MIREKTLRHGGNVLQLATGSVVAAFESTLFGRARAVVVDSGNPETITLAFAVFTNGKRPPSAPGGCVWKFVATLRRRILGVLPLRRLVILQAIEANEPAPSRSTVKLKDKKPAKPGVTRKKTGQRRR